MRLLVVSWMWMVFLLFCSISPCISEIDLPSTACANTLYEEQRFKSVSAQWAENLGVLYRTLAANDTQVAFQLAVEFASEASQYWTPYKCSFDSLGDTESRYIVYDGPYMHEKFNYEKMDIEVVWRYRIALYQVQLASTRTWRDFCPDIVKDILQVTWDENKFHATVTCFNPLHILSKEGYVAIGQSATCLQNMNPSELDRAMRVVNSSTRYLLENNYETKLLRKLSIYANVQSSGKYNLHFNIITPDWKGHFIQYIDLVDEFLRRGIRVSITSTNSFFSQVQNRFSFCQRGILEEGCIWPWNIGAADNSNISVYNAPFSAASRLYVSYRPDLIIFDHVMYVGKALCSAHSIPGISVLTNPFSISDLATASRNLISLRFNSTYNATLHQEALRVSQQNLFNFARHLGSGEILPEETWLEWRCFPPCLAIDAGPINTLATSPLRSYGPSENVSIQSAPWYEFLSTRRDKHHPVAFVAAGSWSSFPNVDVIIDVLLQQNYFVIVSSMNPLNSSFANSENLLVLEPWMIDQPLLLQHTQLFVSHCGFNTLMESIESLTPLICLPLHSDQPANSKRVEYEHIGIYLRTLRKEDFQTAVEMFRTKYGYFLNNINVLRSMIKETTLPLDSVVKLFVSVSRYGTRLISNSMRSDA